MAVNDRVEWQCRPGLVRRHSRSASPFNRATCTPDSLAYSTFGRSSLVLRWQRGRARPAPPALARRPRRTGACARRWIAPSRPSAARAPRTKDRRGACARRIRPLPQGIFDRAGAAHLMVQNGSSEPRSSSTGTPSAWHSPERHCHRLAENGSNESKIST